MTPRRRKRRRTGCWWYHAGEPPFSVEVHERTPGGILYKRLWMPDVVRRSKDGRIRRGAQVRESLHHRDKERAIAEAEAAAKKLRAGAEALTGRSNVAGVLELYLIHRTPQKGTDATRADDRRRAELWIRLYGSRLIGELSSVEWDEFKRLRSSGAIDARGRVVPDERDEEGKPLRRSIGARGVDADLVFITAAFNWALGFKVKGRPLLERNPFGAPAPGVRRTLERPRNRSPRKPIATFDRFVKVRAAAERVMMEARKGEPGAVLVEAGRAKFRRGEGPVRLWMRASYLPELLDLVEATGRRITAICRLQYSDIVREGGAIARVRWRPIKREDETIVPVSDRARVALERVLAQRPGVGDVYLFPSPDKRKSAQPITRQLARTWLRKAEDLAAVGHLEGGSFHPYRRKWATERKHLPRVDVMLAGGWRDERSLKESYQQADDETVLAVVNEPRKLVERRSS